MQNTELTGEESPEIWAIFTARSAFDRPGVGTGPLEATINNLIREIARKGDENRDLQRRWMSQQLELIGLQTAAARDAEALQQLRAEHSVLSARRARLLSQYVPPAPCLPVAEMCLVVGVMHLHSAS